MEHLMAISNGICGLRFFSSRFDSSHRFLSFYCRSLCLWVDCLLHSLLSTFSDVESKSARSFFSRTFCVYCFRNFLRGVSLRDRVEKVVHRIQYSTQQVVFTKVVNVQLPIPIHQRLLSCDSFGEQLFDIVNNNNLILFKC